MGKKTLWISTIVLVLSFIYFEISNIDLDIQDYIFKMGNNNWPAVSSPHANLLYGILYNGVKYPIYIIALITIYYLFLIFIKKKHLHLKKPILIIFLSLAILPGSIAGIFKKITNVHCPYEITRYGGDVPYIRVIEKFPINPKTPDGKFCPGHCFPAGHASGGFALISLYFLFKSRRNKMITILGALSMGWTMGIFQMFRGMHYLSHNFTTMILAFIVVSSLNILIKDQNYESTSDQN